MSEEAAGKRAVNADRERRVQRLLVELLDCNPDERDRRLAEACGDDDAMRAEVVELLAFAEQPDGFLDTPAIEAARESLTAAETSLVGRTLGGYTLHEELGRGGMGIVHRATQRSPEREVAVKVTPFAVSLSARRRFEGESRALARMRHPAIATVFEAGVDALSGLAWIAMELVDGGRPITTFVRETSASLDERLRLFREACDAVHHGHLRGVIHRDLKPSNILVGRDGRVKVIDFGVARLLGPDDSRASFGATASAEAGPIGTLASMSPEQCGGEPIDLRTDVYSMGVVLHEMIAGAPPFDLAKRSLESSLRTIRTVPPPPLRRVAPGTPRDLETVALTALEKDAARRYQSMAALADDIQRIREHRPIEARPAGWAHHLALFVRRHVALAGATVVILAVLVAATVVSLRFAIDAERQRDAAVRTSYAAILASANAAYDAHEIHRLRERLALAPTDFRGWEWRFLERQSRPEQSVLRLHGQRVSAVAWSPSADAIASADMNGTLRVWRPDESGGATELAPAIDLGKPAYAVAWSGDGRLLAAAAMLTPIRLFRVASRDDSSGGITLEEIDRSFPLLSGGVSSVDLSHDGSLLTYAGERGARIWRTIDATPLASLDDRGALRSVRFAPDGRRIALAREASVEIRDALDGALLTTIANGVEYVDAIAWAPDGTTIASGTQDGRITINRLADGAAIASRRVHTRPVRSIVITPDGARVVSGGDDHRIVESDASDLRERRVLAGHFDGVLALSLGPDGERIVSSSADRTARVWTLDAEDRTRRSIGPRWRPSVTALAHTAEGRVFVGTEFGTLELLDAAAWRPLASSERAGIGYRHAAASRDGSRVAVGHGRSSVLLVDGASGAEIARVEQGDEGGEARVLSRSATAVTFSPDGVHVATGGSDAAIRIYRIEIAADGERLTLERVIEGGAGVHAGEVTALAYAPDGATLYAASVDRVLAAWSVGADADADADGKAPRWKRSAHTDAILSLAVHPQDGTLVSGGRDQRLLRYAPDDGRVLGSVEGHGQAISAIAFLPDGSRLFTGSLFGDVRVWNWPRCEELLTLRASAIEVVRTLSVAPDGREIVAGGRGGLMRWNIDLVRPLRSRSDEPLTNESDR